MHNGGTTMQTADFNHNDFSSQASRESDKALLVKFFVKPKQSQAQSLKEGRPVYRDTEYIDIKVAGNRSGGACRPATSADKQRFPEHYAAFKQRTDHDVEIGTPLIEWPLISRSFAEELAFFHVKTVEQLATMADTQVSKFMGGYDIRTKAKKWIDQAAKDKPMWEMDGRMKKMEEENESLKASLAALISEMEVPDKTAHQVKRALKKAKKQTE
jgi:hypothetical protein